MGSSSYRQDAFDFPNGQGDAPTMEHCWVTVVPVRAHVVPSGNSRPKGYRRSHHLSIVPIHVCVAYTAGSVDMELDSTDHPQKVCSLNQEKEVVAHRRMEYRSTRCEVKRTVMGFE